MESRLQKFLENKEDHSFDIPFQHYVFDDFLVDNFLDEINLEEIVKCSHDGHVRRFRNDQEDKIAISHIKNGKVYDVLKYMNSPSFVEFLQQVTGIENLLVDNDFHGGGVHMIPKGGKLGVHVDFSRAIFDNTKFRRLNALLYMNKNWYDEYNGHLELWDKKPSDGGVAIKKILPIFNRLVIFGTKKGSWHGHPTPLACPEDRFRISLATYYYSDEPGDDVEEHSTIF